MRKRIFTLFLVLFLFSNVLCFAQVSSLDEITTNLEKAETDNVESNDLTTENVTKDVPKSETVTTIVTETVNTKDVVKEEVVEKEVVEKEVEKSTGETVGDIMSNLTPNSASLNAANVALTPVSEFVNKAVSYLVVLILIGFSLSILIDLVFIAFPFARGILLKQSENTFQRMNQQMPGQSFNQPMVSQGYGRMPGGTRFGSSMGVGSGMGISPQTGVNNQPLGDFTKPRWISDSAFEAFNTSISVDPNIKPVVKNMLFLYVKKHTLFLIIFSATLLLYTSPVLFQLGFKFGQFIVDNLGRLV
jgi:hypothetical protein